MSCEEALSNPRLPRFRSACATDPWDSIDGMPFELYPDGDICYCAQITGSDQRDGLEPYLCELRVESGTSGAICCRQSTSCSSLTICSIRLMIIVASGCCRGELSQRWDLQEILNLFIPWSSPLPQPQAICPRQTFSRSAQSPRRQLK